MLNYYQILGISESASQDEIKKAFKKLAMTHHPDRGGNEERFKQINEAYGVLGDENKRQNYDQQRQVDQMGGFGFPGFSFHFGQGGDIFGTRFGQGFRQRTQPNKHVNLKVQLTLEEIFTGKNIIGSMRLPSGREETIDIFIPPGVEKGDAIRFRGMGDDTFDQLPRGDLIAIIEEIPHPKFRRQGADLQTDINISAFDAILGTNIFVDTIDYRKLQVTVPPGTQPFAVLNLSNQGLPYKQNSINGNLYVRVIIDIPKNLTDEQRKIINDIRSSITA